ncbi:piggyBac transposable element-derived protein 4-like [Eupeodes corollae]|uniref:piggyBac transposable element-derived protein 4-like n=1 Tax=Eupeodes corollae TaxID=290404 RepID=UPI002490D051|nr:piggyBac transposable element-derived protein 4-like [Eupeodes corollae]
MLDLESDEEGETDPFYAGGDDEQNDPDFLPNVEFDSDYEDIDETSAEMLGPIESLPEPDEVESDIDQESTTPVSNDVCFLAHNGRKWMKDPETAALSRVQGSNVFKPGGTVGSTINLKNSSLIQIFNRIFNLDMRNEIIKRTNEKDNDIYEKLNAKRTEQRFWKPLNMNELQAYFVVLLYIGTMKDGHRRLRTLWDPIHGHTILRAVMSFTRFEELNLFLRFDDSIGRRGQSAAKKNILQPVEFLLKELNQTLTSNYIPSENLTIDEQLKAFRGRCKFRQYMPSKPAKYGIKFWWLNQSSTGYPLQFSIYTGSSDQSVGLGRGYDVVMSLMPRYFHTGRNLTVDNFFTSVNLALKLLDKKITLLGTIRKNKRDIPKPFVVKELLNEYDIPIKINNKKQYRPLYSSLCGFSEKMALVSYVPTPRKQVVLLSTQHIVEKAVFGPQNKPLMILDYNRTKGGVDVFDQMVSIHSCSRQTNRWPMVVFYNLLDVSALATVIIFRHFNPPSKNIKVFRNEKLIQLAQELMEKELDDRSHPSMEKLQSQMPSLSESRRQEIEVNL